MSERAYTVAEIDALRAACNQRYLWGTTAGTGSAISRAYREDEKTKSVEEMVRIYMSGGVTAQEIYRHDAEIAAQLAEARKPKPPSDEELAQRRKNLTMDLSAARKP